LTPAAEDPRQFGDGAPLHSAIPFDLTRMLNNGQTFREPSFQFLHDISLLRDDDSNAKQRIRWHQKTVVGDGECMLGQAPIYVPVDATRLRWSLGIYRTPASGPDPVPVNINVNTVTMYLCSDPCRVLTSVAPGTEDADDECQRFFYEPWLTGAWTKNVVSAGATANGFGDPMFTRVRSSTWTNFAPRGVLNINDRLGDPYAYLIVTCAFSAGLPNESIRGAELSVWFEYDDAPFLLDDATREASRNGKPALAQVMRVLTTAANRFSCRAKPILNWWGGNDITPWDDTEEATVRRLWITGSNGAPAPRGQALVVPIANMLGAQKTGLETYLENDTQNGVGPVVPQTPGRREDLNTLPAVYYPKYATPLSIFAENVADYAGGAATARQVRVHSGGAGGAGPQFRSGMIIERKAIQPVVGVEALPLDPFAMGAEVVGEGAAFRDLRAFRDFINRLMREKMIHFGWGICRNTLSGAYGHNVTYDAAAGEYRYILNPLVGQGGIAPTVDGPGIEIPTRYTSLGLGTTVRAYVYVYAWMTGGANTGALGFYNRNNSGGMTSAAAVTNTPTISGTTPQWYPVGGTFNPATAPYFNLNANPSYDCDNVVLCAKRSGGTDNVMIGAWTICVRASEA
jgi:hypothetical protein